MGIIILKIVYEKNEKKSTKHFVIFVQTKSFVCIEVAQVMSVNCIKFAFKTCKKRRIDENEENNSFSAKWDAFWDNLIFWED